MKIECFLRFLRGVGNGKKRDGFAIRKSAFSFFLFIFVSNILWANVSATQTLESTQIDLIQRSNSLKRTFQTIEEKTPFHFAFVESQVNRFNKINLSKSAYNLSELLNELFAKTNLTYSLNGNTIVVYSKSIVNSLEEIGKSVQEIPIKGVVISNTGGPLAGVSVMVKGTNIGTTTDENGNFNLEVSDKKSVLIFSYVGYEETEEAVGDSRELTVVMSPLDNSLEQVVVVGYGTQRKKDLTGAVASVSGDDIAKMPNTNPISSLQGKVAGLTVSNSGSPGAAPTVRIRGINSTNSASPLYVVDGILQDNIDFLNPADIESIDILRDPSSIAVYGLQGANGVIAITTKSAAPGQTRINLLSSAGFDKVNHKIAVTDADGFKKLYNAQLANLGEDSFDYSNYDANTDWQDLILRKAFFTNNSLSISNSSDKSTTYLNVGYNKQEGVVKYGEYDRLTARLKEEIRVSDRIKIGGDINGSYWNLNPMVVSITNALWAAPIVPVRAGDDLYYSMPSFQRGQVGNPIATLNRGNRTSVSRGYRFVGSAYVEVKIAKGLVWKSTVYTDLGFNNSRNYSPLPFRFINLGEMGGITDTTYDASQYTSISQSSDEFRRFQQDHTLTWDKSFAGGHRLSAVGGFTTVYTDNTNLNGYRRDTILNIPNDKDFWYIGVVNANNPTTNGGGGGKSSLAGAFARASYAFLDKYLLNATVRRDGSSKFAPKNRWGTFGSIGAGWVISEENFFHSTAVDFVKLRAAWGKIGNSNGVADNLYQPGVSNASTAIFGDNVYTAVQAAYIPDPDLHWEVVRGIDLGVDVRALENRLSAEINFYDRTTSDILTSIEIPNDTRKYFTNLGKITNRGMEIALGWKETLGNGFFYAINGNYSYNKNVVNSIGDSINFQIQGNGGVNRTESGKSIGYFYGYKQTGVYQTPHQMENLPYYSGALPGDLIYADRDGNDTINTADRGYLGTPFPPYSFGLSFNIGYKGFDVLIEGQGVAGNKIYTQRRTSRFATLNYEANRLNAWTGPGTTNIEPILDATRGNNYLFSSYYLEPGDYFRLRTVQLGYNFDLTLLNKTFVKKARVYVSGQNMVTWTKVTGYSPEAPISNILGGGADNGIYPISASYSVGFNLTF